MSVPRRARPTVTLHDVARRAGVSVATASRVLGDSGRLVGPEYRERVLAAAAELRYVADASARAMRRGSDAVALLADDLTTPTIALVVAAMERAARAAGSYVTVSSTGGTEEGQLRAVEVSRALRHRALVLTSGRVDASALGGKLLEALRSYVEDGGRVVMVGDTDLPFTSIGFDNRGAARTVGRFVAEQGHEHVVILAGPPGNPAGQERVAGFTEGLSATSRIRTVACERSRQGGFDAMTGLIGEKERPDVVLGMNDVVAIGALAALNSAGVQVPDEVSVVGFDDIPLAADVTPRLTTLALPFGQVGAEAIARALDADGETGRLRVGGRLVVRDSLRLAGRAAPHAFPGGPAAG
ncbi:LacI family DNA-binding transcriptional regulator [Amycolatopsis suaedae]|uniref:LacI family DNA-binding transcriptional regulator n=1 Tax=Amycolatopsis suaedae TaxID=2510978 RepID=UPI0013EF502B|nr:LacI family DNA-binding transcriptional regulator [Amycolatopsis suaedae]